MNYPIPGYATLELALQIMASLITHCSLVYSLWVIPTQLGSHIFLVESADFTIKDFHLLASLRSEACSNSPTSGDVLCTMFGELPAPAKGFLIIHCGCNVFEACFVHLLVILAERNELC